MQTFYVDICTESCDRVNLVKPYTQYKEHPSMLCESPDGRAAVMQAIEDTFVIMPKDIQWYDDRSASVCIEHDNGNATEWFFTAVFEEMGI